MSKKEITRDKYWSEDDPKNNVDFIEISLPMEKMDMVVRKYAPNYIMDDEEDDQEDKQKQSRKKERLIKKIFQAASQTLTQRQLQIFVMRHICAMKEVVIAQKLEVHQSYVSNVLKVCVQKIQKGLRLIP